MQQQLKLKVDNGSDAKKVNNNQKNLQQQLKRQKLKKKISINSQYFVMCKIGSFDNDYKIACKIGQGSFGTVYKVYHKGLKIHRALKTIKKKTEQKYKNEQIDILKKLDHCNILKIYQFYELQQYYYIITQLFQGKQLFDQILQYPIIYHRQQKLSQNLTAIIIKEILRALFYTHNQGIAHRDIKPQNILIRKSNHQIYIKIIDWGLGTLIGNNHINRVCGTPQYCAPQVLKGKYSLSCDMWSVGVITYVMLTGQMPFSGKNTQQTMKIVSKGILNTKSKSFSRLSAQSKKFITALVTKDPNHRLRAQQALNHEWLNKNNKEDNNGIELKETLERLMQFKITNSLGIAILSYINNHLSTEQQRQKLQKIFKYLDRNNDGVLSEQQLILGYSELYGKQLAIEIVSQIFNRIDINNSGILEYSEFITFGLKRKQQQDINKLYQAFNLFDKDKDGKISWQQINNIIHYKINQLTQNQINYILHDFNLNQNKFIQFNQFVNSIKSLYNNIVIKKSGIKLSTLNKSIINNQKYQIKQIQSQDQNSSIHLINIPQQHNIPNLNQIQNQNLHSPNHQLQQQQANNSLKNQQKLSQFINNTPQINKPHQNQLPHIQKQKQPSIITQLKPNESIKQQQKDKILNSSKKKQDNKSALKSIQKQPLTLRRSQRKHKSKF